MADITQISWTDHTFNPWWGCTKIAPGCDNCYAATFDKRVGGDYWNVKTKPRRTSATNWKKPIKWNKQAEQEGKRHRVFCGSMMDWCDKNAPEGALDDLWELIRITPWLDWQLLTKRATLIKKRLPDDWGLGYENVWLGVTCEDMNFGYKRIEQLIQIPASIKFVSAEPLLEELINFPKSRIDWLIIGGESGPGHRKIKRAWVENLIRDCDAVGMAVWFKQWGGIRPDSNGCKVFSKEWKMFP